MCKEKQNIFPTGVTPESLMELIKKLFGNKYEDVIVVDVDGNEHNADDMTVKELKSYDINKIDEIKAYEDKMYIYF